MSSVRWLTVAVFLVGGCAPTVDNGAGGSFRTEADLNVGTFLAWWNQNVAVPFQNEVTYEIGVSGDTNPADATLIGMAGAGEMITVSAIAADTGGPATLDLALKSYSALKMFQLGTDAGTRLNNSDLDGALRDVMMGATALGISDTLQTLKVNELVSDATESEVLGTLTTYAIKSQTKDYIQSFNSYISDLYVTYSGDGTAPDIQCDGCTPPDPLYLEPPPDPSADPSDPSSDDSSP